MKRLISFILCMLMLLSLVPATAFATDAASETDIAYDLPEAGDKVNILCTGKAEEAKIGGKNVTYNIHHDGEPYSHTVKFRKFAANNDKNYDPDIILYCIQFVVIDTGSYEAARLCGKRSLTIPKALHLGRERRTPRVIPKLGRVVPRPSFLSEGGKVAQSLFNSS